MTDLTDRLLEDLGARASQATRDTSRILRTSDDLRIVEHADGALMVEGDVTGRGWLEIFRAEDRETADRWIDQVLADREFFTRPRRLAN
jgi:hypothetical protein